MFFTHSERGAPAGKLSRGLAAGDGGEHAADACLLVGHLVGVGQQFVVPDGGGCLRLKHRQGIIEGGLHKSLL